MSNRQWFLYRKGDYDHRSGHYAATSNNLHWWPQIQLSDGEWLSLEPTPGYEPPREQMRWRDRVALMSKALFAGMTSHPFLTLFSLVTCMSLWLFWKRLADGIFTMLFRIASLISDELRFEWAIWLIEKRASLAGVGRPASQTPKRWYPKLVETTPSERSSFELLIEREYLKRYAPTSRTKRSLCLPIDNSKQVTNTILARWTVRNMQLRSAAQFTPGFSFRMEKPIDSHRSIDQLKKNLNQTLLGKSDVIEWVVACLLARGHLLFDDLPGLGKTTLAKALAQSMGGKLARVQCTPDLLPSDITGFSVLNQKNREFEFRMGRSFRIFCSPMKSTAQHRARKVLCLKQWLNGK